jgi:hypothetical protein
MSTVLDRVADLSDITIEPFSSMDGQGDPQYSLPEPAEARVVREDQLVRQPDGSEVRTTLTAYVTGCADRVPAHQGRLGFDASKYIVVERKVRTRLDGEVDHVRVRCREE